MPLNGMSRYCAPTPNARATSSHQAPAAFTSSMELARVVVEEHFR